MMRRGVSPVAPDLEVSGVCNVDTNLPGRSSRQCDGYGSTPCSWRCANHCAASPPTR
jgi:hypothetical protein